MSRLATGGIDSRWGISLEPSGVGGVHFSKPNCAVVVGQSERVSVRQQADRISAIEMLGPSGPSCLTGWPRKGFTWPEVRQAPGRIPCAASMGSRIVA